METFLEYETIVSQGISWTAAAVAVVSQLVRVCSVGRLPTEQTH